MTQNQSHLKLRRFLLLCLVLCASLAAFGPAGATAETDYLGTWGAPGTGDGQFDTPWDAAAAPNGDVYFADRGNYRIQRFSAAGQFLGKWGSMGMGNGQFIDLVAVAVGTDGKVFALDRIGGGATRVQRFDADGSFEAGWATVEGSAVGELKEPVDIAVGPSGRVYVLDAGNHRVQSFDPDGSDPAVWGTVGNGGEGQFAEPVGIAVNATSGEVYVADGGGTPQVQAFSATGDFIRQWGTAGSEAGQFPPNGLVAIAVGDTGDVYTRELLSSESDSNRFQRFTSTGELVADQYLYSPDSHGFAVSVDALLAPATLDGKIQVIYLRRVATSLLAPYTPVGVGERTIFQATTQAPFSRVTNHEWDLDGDGIYELDTGPVPEAHHVYSQIGHYTARLRVISEVGGVGSDAREVRVRVPPLSGPIGISINDGARYTRDPNVTVTVRWPRWMDWLRISDDGGFSPSAVMPVQEKISWRLDTGGAQRRPRTVYLRFGQSGFEEETTYTDDIYLDLVKPTIRVTEVPVQAGPPQLRLKARDKVSGVAKMQLRRNGKKQGWRPFKKSLRLAGSADGLRVRVKDKAGNLSRWARVRHP
jgi:DNA-binding beta-propeller fold protein YncE